LVITVKENHLHGEAVDGLFALVLDLEIDTGHASIQQAVEILCLEFVEAKAAIDVSRLLRRGT
jgi:hypothetical protein